MVRLAMVVRAEGGNILFCICTTFAEWDHVMRLEKHTSVRCCESWLGTVLAESLSSIKSSRAKPCIANECHSRNHAALHLSFSLRLQRELIDKPSR